MCKLLIGNFSPWKLGENHTFFHWEYRLINLWVHNTDRGLSQGLFYMLGFKFPFHFMSYQEGASLYILAESMKITL